MTLAQLREAKPHLARSWDLVVVQGLGLQEAARRLGVADSTVGHHVRMAKAFFEGVRLVPRGMNRDWAEFDAKLTAQGRCACGLLKPCSCEAGDRRDEAFTSRPGPGPAYPEGMSW